LAGASFGLLAPSSIVAAYSRLRVYELSAALADELWRTVVRWPRPAWGSFGLQLVRAADSVGANIAKATGRWHSNDKRRLLYIARAKARGFLDERRNATVQEIGRMLNGLIRRPNP
jgi:hypothetical protein